MDEGGEFVVSYDAVDTYGVGETPWEAVTGFASMLIDLYQELESTRKFFLLTSILNLSGFAESCPLTNPSHLHLLYERHPERIEPTEPS